MKDLIRAIPFLLIFPGFFIYHWSSRNDWIPMFFGGYINEVSAIVCASAILGYMRVVLSSYRKSIVLTTVDVCFLGFMVWFASISLVHYFADTAPGVSKTHLAAWGQMLACYLSMRIIPFNFIGKWSFVFACLISVAVLWAVQADMLNLLMSSIDERSAATYQGLARAFMITAVFGLIFVRVSLYKYIYYSLILIVLFFIGARSEVAGALIVFIVFEVVLSQRSGFSLVAFCVALFAGAFVFYMGLDFLIDWFPDNRLLFLIIEGREDGSVLERNELQEMAWNAVIGNPVFGDYGHYERQSSVGAYAHSWVSVWVDLGLMGLILYMYFYYQCARESLRLHAFVKLSGMDETILYSSISFGLLAMVIILSVFAKNFVDPNMAMVAGFIGHLLELKTQILNGDNERGAN